MQFNNIIFDEFRIYSQKKKSEIILWVNLSTVFKICIYSVNGVSLKYYVTRKEAVQHIKKAGAKIVMEVQKNPESNWAGKSNW